MFCDVESSPPGRILDKLDASGAAGSGWDRSPHPPKISTAIKFTRSQNPPLAFLKLRRLRLQPPNEPARDTLIACLLKERAISPQKRKHGGINAAGTRLECERQCQTQVRPLILVLHQERLRDHAKAFDGLLSLIPAKMYYGEDTSVRCLYPPSSRPTAWAPHWHSLSPP
jgi:hypothetical protein